MDSSTIIYEYGGNQWGVVSIPSRNLVILQPLLPISSPVAIIPHATYPAGSTRSARSLLASLGLALLVIALGGIVGPLIPTIRMEGNFLAKLASTRLDLALNPATPLPPSAPVIFSPLVTPEGSSIDPVNRDFSLIIPKIGLNTAVTANIDPTRPDLYIEALKLGVAHSASSYLPNQDGTMYLFSHSTNYDWFVRDLNAVFYLLKNLEAKDTIVVFYKGKQYTYKMTGKKVTSPNEISYLVPTYGQKKLILQTCWPPGSVAQRLLIFADLVEERGQEI